MFVANQKKMNRNPVGVICITHLHKNSFSYLLGQIPTFFLRSLFCCSHCNYKHATPAGVYGIRVLKQVSFLYDSLRNPRLMYYN